MRIKSDLHVLSMHTHKHMENTLLYSWPKHERKERERERERERECVCWREREDVRYHARHFIVSVYCQNCWTNSIPLKENERGWAHEYITIWHTHNKPYARTLTHIEIHLINYSKSFQRDSQKWLAASHSFVYAYFSSALTMNMHASVRVWQNVFAFFS